MSTLRHRSACVAVVLSLGWCAAGRAADPKPVRVGVLGLDNYQAVAYAQLFNDPKASAALAGVCVVAAFPAAASADIPESVESLPKWTTQIVAFKVELVDSVAELLRRCDAVMI